MAGHSASPFARRLSLSNKRLLLRGDLAGISSDLDRSVSCARRSSLLYRLDPVPGELGAHRLADKWARTAESRVRWEALSTTARMSMFDAFRRKSPTATWREDLTALMVLDLDRFELNGVGFGGEVDGLRFLGPSESRAFDYPPKGLQLDVDSSGLLEGLVVALRDGVYLGVTPPRNVKQFAGRIRLNGRDLAPHEFRSESEFVRAWGEPYWRDVDDDETLLFFEFERGEVQVELTPDGVPQVALVTPEPLMADLAQRQAYRVTAAWPPPGLASAS